MTTNTIKIDTAEFTRRWERGDSSVSMGAHFGCSERWILMKAAAIGLAKRARAWNARRPDPVERVARQPDDPVQMAAMKPGLMDAVARAGGSVRLLGMLAPKYGVPYAVLNTLAQGGARK